MPAHQIDRLLTGRGLARHLGVTENAVREARASGRLDRSVVRRGGRIWFDPELAAVEWLENADPLRVEAAKDALSGPIAPRRGIPGRKRAAARQGNGRAPARNEVPTPMAEARTRRAEAQAALAELEVQRRSGAAAGPSWDQVAELVRYLGDALLGDLQARGGDIAAAQWLIAHKKVGSPEEQVVFAVVDAIHARQMRDHAETMRTVLRRIRHLKDGPPRNLEDCLAEMEVERKAAAAAEARPAGGS